MVLRKGQLPASPRGHRLLCEPLAIKTETESGLAIPAIAQHRPNSGRIIAAGLNARDAMYDHGDELGDVIWWGKFAGVIEEWDRIVEETKAGVNCDHTWDRQASPGKDQSAWTCGKCNSKRLASPLCVLNHDDILANESLQRRIENGVIAQQRGKTAGGATQHFMARKE